MIVLGIDASAASAGVAVAGPGGVQANAFAGGTGRRPAAQLLSLADGALRAAGLDRNALSGLAVATGPGSFAGIRAAVTTAKALAFATGLPLAAVGSLEALAFTACPWDGPVWAALDARRDRVYAACYRPEAGVLVECSPPALLDRAAFHAAVQGVRGDPALAGPGVSAADIAALGTAGCTAVLVGPVGIAALPAATAWLGRLRLQAGQSADPMTLVPAYVGSPEIGRPARGPGG